jgi:putative DNA primase/helicase
MTARPAMPAVGVLLAERMPDLARDLAGDPSHRGRETWRFRSRGSLAVVVAGQKRGSWFDHEAGAGGDALALVAHLRREPMRAAYAWALAWLDIGGGALAPATPRAAVAAPEAPREASGTGDLARSLWREAVPAAGSLVESYLASRGLRLEPDAPIRFHPRAWRNRNFGPPGPAMVALMTDPASNNPCGAHITYLRPDGAGKADGERARIMLGGTGVVRLVPDEDVVAGLAIAEGIETTLAVMQRTGWRPVWAATSAGAIARFPVLTGIEALTVFADADGAGIGAARECCRRWAAVGREARILAPPAGDWDDALPHTGRAA